MMQKESTDRKEKFAAFAAQMANESYTSGESDEQSNFHVPFNMLPKKDKKKRIIFMWGMAFKKAKGSSLIIRKLFDQQSRIYLGGFANKNNVVHNADQEAINVKMESVRLRNNILRQKVKWMIFPKDSKKLYWDILIMLLLVYTGLFVPYSVCFIENTPDGLFAWSLVVDFLFMTDLVLTFFTAYEDPDTGELITDRVEIAKNYFKLWFWIDLVTSIPF